jgi:hypothetical protein
MAFAVPVTAASEPAQPDVLTIMAKVAEKNEERAAAIQGYTGRRIYHLLYRGFPGDKEAEMVVSARYEPPAGKQFHIVSQQGSKFIQDKVFQRLLASEQEATERGNREETALTPRNYDFTLLGEEDAEGSHRYVVAVSPRTNNKFLYRGTVWIDAEDYAVARIEAEPARNPSFWTSKSRVLHVYRKVGDFWLPAENRSTSHIRLGGQATLTIQYLDYELTDGSPPVPRVHAAHAVPAVDGQN